MSIKLSDSILEEIGAGIAEEQAAEVPFDYESWEPPGMGERQREVYYSDAPYILCHGERFSGKSFIGGGEKLVKHLYEEFNALALIIVLEKGNATLGGIWEKLQTMVLPRWKHGVPLEEGEVPDETKHELREDGKWWAPGPGIEYTEPKFDDQKRAYIAVQNRWGGWSRVFLVSVPHVSQLRARVRGFEPSYVFVDEITEMEDRRYFDLPVQQLGRRPIIKCQQYVAACNPDGPSHWVHKVFFEEPIDDEGEWDPEFLTIHIPFYQNKKNLEDPDGYENRLRKGTRGDKIEEARMMRGEWIDRPSGDAIFREVYDVTRHVIGTGRQGIMPSTRFPIILGYDLGLANNSISFLQLIIGKDQAVWTVFDEIVKTGAKINYNTLVPVIMKKLQRWCTLMDHKFTVLHFSDSNAFDVYRPHGDGSYDVLEVERISKKEKKKGRFDQVEVIKMEPAPKFNGSVEVRVRLLKSLLVEDRLVVSNTCPAHKQMFLNLKSPKPKKGVYDPAAAFKPVRSIHLHSFDSLSYPVIAFDSGSAKPDSGKKKNRGETVVAFGG